MSCQFVSMLQNMILLGGISTSGSKPSAAGSVREGDAREQRAAFRLARNGTAWKRSVADFAATRSGQRGSNSLPGIPRIGFADSQEPCRISHFICALRIGRGSEFAFYKKTGHPNRMSCQFVSILQNVILLGDVSTSGSKPSAAGSVRKGDAREQCAAFRLARNGTAWKRSVADFAATRSGQRGSNSLPGIPRIGSADSQEPCRTSHFICALRMGGGSEFAFYEKNRTSESDVLFQSGAGNEARTRYLHLGKVALYQMSYARENRYYSSRSFSFCQQFFQ